MDEKEKLKELLKTAMRLLSEARPGLFLKAEISQFKEEVNDALKEDREI